MSSNAFERCSREDLSTRDVSPRRGKTGGIISIIIINNDGGITLITLREVKSSSTKNRNNWSPSRVTM